MSNHWSEIPWVIGLICNNECDMGDFTQPQQKYAGTGENCNIAIPVIFYPVRKSLRKLLCISFGCVGTQILNLRAENNFANMLKISG